MITELPSKGGSWIDRVEPRTASVEAATIDVTIVLGSAAAGAVDVTLAFNGAAPGAPVSAPVSADGLRATLLGVALPEGTRPWTLGAGNLFTLTVTLVASGDALSVRSGLRALSAVASGNATRLAVNGEVVKLRGFNRHTMWPDTGAAVTPEQEAVDLALVLGVRANYIRGGHYPQSQHWLDLLDENGIAIWEEALGPGTSTKNMQDPYFMSNTLAATRAMAEASIAHPSVIMRAAARPVRAPQPLRGCPHFLCATPLHDPPPPFFLPDGFFNEGPSSDVNACPGYAANAAAVRAASGSAAWRMVTWASDKTTSDKCLANADIVSFNNYPGWYQAPGDIGDAATTWKRLVDWATSTYPGKPFTVSETGGGGIYEWNNASAPAPGPFWSQQYQSSLVSADVNYLLGDARVTGLSLWLLIDFKVDGAAAREATARAARATDHPLPPSPAPAQTSRAGSATTCRRPPCALATCPCPGTARLSTCSAAAPPAARPSRAAAPMGRITRARSTGGAARSSNTASSAPFTAPTRPAKELAGYNESTIPTYKARPARPPPLSKRWCGRGGARRARPPPPRPRRGARARGRPRRP